MISEPPFQIYVLLKMRNVNLLANTLNYVTPPPLSPSQ